jgi:hypothetical protein
LIDNTPARTGISRIGQIFYFDQSCLWEKDALLRFFLGHGGTPCDLFWAERDRLALVLRLAARHRFRSIAVAVTVTTSKFRGPTLIDADGADVRWR